MKTRSVKSICLAATFLAGLGALAAQPALAQDDDVAKIGDGKDAADGDASAGKTKDEVLVTGTRMMGLDPSARVDVITSEEIARRGMATAEDIVRSIPQNLSSVNSVTNSGRGVYGPDASASNSRGQRRGYSAANLRGLGSANTLVLVDGKRIVSASTDADFNSNLRDIPAAAIERIEISFDSASAIYGSDAVGGVINIILKKGYTGAQLAGRYEKSSTGADLWRVNSYFGKNWGTGSVSGNVSYEVGDPISNFKTGWVTRDYRDRFGPDADFRHDTQSRSGVVDITLFNPFRRQKLILPPGSNGVGATDTDFVLFDSDADVLDYIDRDASSKTKDLSVAFNADQELFSGFKVSGDVIYTEARSSSTSSFFDSDQFYVPASNAFNPFGRNVTVNYFPIREIESGLISPPSESARTKQLRFGGRIDYEISEDLTWVADFTRSVSQDSRSAMLLNGPGNPIFDDFLPPDTDLVALQRLRDIMASSDPSATINVFGDGTAQSTLIQEFIQQTHRDSGKSKLMEGQSYFTGNAFDLPAGAIGFVIGGEWRRETINTAFVAEEVGFPDPSRNSWAAFGELHIPIFSDQNEIPFFRELSLTAQARYDKYHMEGAVDSQPDPNDPFADGTPIYGTANFDAISPRFGIAWSPIYDLRLRASYSTGFKAPGMLDLFSTFSYGFTNTTAYDPLLDDFVVVQSYKSGPNPDLNPEVSHNYNAGFDYTPSWAPGLLVRADYSRIDFKNLILFSTDLEDLLPREVYGNIPDIFIRDDMGTLIAVVDKPVNIARRVRHSVDADVSYYFSTPWGDFAPGANVSYVIRQFDQVSADVEPVSFVGSTKGVDRYKLQGRMNWTNGAWGADLYVNYTPGYVNNANDFDSLNLVPRNLPPEARTVKSYTTVDLTANYSFEGGLTLRAGARNLFNADFPFCLCDDGMPYDPVRVDLRGRVAFIEASYDFSSLLGH